MQVELAQAAEALGVSEQSLHRQIAKGNLSASRLRRGTGGYSWLIDLPDDLPPLVRTEPTTLSGILQTLASLEAKIDGAQTKASDSDS